MNRQFWHRNASIVLTCLGGVGVDCILISMPFAPDLEWQEEY